MIDGVSKYLPHPPSGGSKERYPATGARSLSEMLLRMYMKPAPNGAVSHLWPPQTTMSTGTCDTSNGKAPSCWIASTTSRTPDRLHSLEMPSRLQRYPLLHWTELITTAFVRPSISSSKAESGSSPSLFLATRISGETPLLG